MGADVTLFDEEGSPLDIECTRGETPIHISDAIKRLIERSPPRIGQQIAINPSAAKLELPGSKPLNEGGWP